MDYIELSITNIQAISAIYFALLQCKYDFYPIEREALLIDKLRSFIMSDCVEYDFFCDVKQNTCEVYPYWPRAAMLETATFYIDSLREQFTDFNAYKNSIMSAKNILNIERNQLFWDWIIKFPKTLKLVLQSNSFSRYLKWENDWIAEQNEICHRYIYSGYEKSRLRLPDVYKSAFFILQNLYYLKHGEFIRTKMQLLTLLSGKDKAVLEHSISLNNAETYDFAESFTLLFTWCQDTLANL